MGNAKSYPGLTQDVLEDYTNLTYLSKGEILHLMKKFYSINPDKLEADYQYRFSKEDIVNKFEVLRNNPFQDRLFRVFSSHDDGRFSFEDLLDLCSAMCPECPLEVKAAWAFKVFDLDDDNQISAKDICQIIDRLTWTGNNRSNFLDRESKAKIAEIILEETKLDSSGSIGLSEFKIMMSRIPEFSSSFYFKL
ncbi:calcium and integrin-binding protein 1-like isoform X1 [Bombyx mandarina]|uniref:EF-hand domain-containing protein n=4 Tax=Bombyx TaxID=7090 RepID=A0A8R2ARS6_BOMMO|nr:calcium and integrin-binding protein 1-like isoform X1 [Bombyx mori]XP_028025403.1 calcium and integrin-binding protein 1-like isoform X1 [Bombyx mandarina]